jgi:hypothetical protein
MTNPADPEFPGPAIPESAYRVIHSALVDLMHGLPPQMGDYILKQLGGRVTLGSMTQAMKAGRMSLAVFLDDNEHPYLELAVTAGDGHPFTLLEVDGPSVGVDPAALWREQQYRLDQAVAAITGEVA